MTEILHNLHMYSSLHRYKPFYNITLPNALKNKLLIYVQKKSAKYVINCSCDKDCCDIFVENLQQIQS